MEKLAHVFGQVLYEKRLQQGLTQEQLAERCHLDRKYIYLLEKGKNQPSLRSIFLLSAALMMTPVALVAEVQQRLDASSAE